MTYQCCICRLKFYTHSTAAISQTHTLSLLKDDCCASAVPNNTHQFYLSVLSGFSCECRLTPRTASFSLACSPSDSSHSLPLDLLVPVELMHNSVGYHRLTTRGWAARAGSLTLTSVYRMSVDGRSVLDRLLPNLTHCLSLDVIRPYLVRRGLLSADDHEQLLKKVGEPRGAQVGHRGRGGHWLLV